MGIILLITQSQLMQPIKALLALFLLCVIARETLALEVQQEEDAPFYAYYLVMFDFDFPALSLFDTIFTTLDTTSTSNDSRGIFKNNEPDFSSVMDASQCADIVDYQWKVDCLNSVITNMQNRMNN